MLVGNSLSAWKHTTDWQGMEERGEVQGPHNLKVVSQTFGCHASPQNTLVISSLVMRKKIFERTYYIKLKKCSTHHCTHYLRRKYLFFSPLKNIFFDFANEAKEVPLLKNRDVINLPCTVAFSHLMHKFGNKYIISIIYELMMTVHFYLMAIRQTKAKVIKYKK